jgi:hypothetical protein
MAHSPLTTAVSPTSSPPDGDDEPPKKPFGVKYFPRVIRAS